MIEESLKTSIVCTIGPTSDSVETLSSMMSAGMNVARLNFSHGNMDHHDMLISRIRKVAASMELPVAILQDLQGPKLRIGDFIERNIVQLLPGSRFVITTDVVEGNSERVSTPYIDLPKVVQTGDLMLLNDGALELEVESTTPTEVITRVNIGGDLPARKGINIPNISLDMKGLTSKDLRDLEFGLNHKVDYIAISFVQSEKDIVDVKKAMMELNSERSETPIISKLECPASLDNLEKIIDVSDGVMVARGDLGVEIGVEKVPSVQKNIIEAANVKGKFVIIATQMLESMIHSRRPTRAEASDVANAIFDGADAVMLSAETAVGANPVDAVRVISEIIREAEQHENEWGHFVENMSLYSDKIPALALARAARELAETLKASAVAVFTRSGSTATLVSKTRPPVPVVAFTTETDTYNKLALLRGVVPFVVPRAMNLEEITRSAEHVLLEASNIKEGDKIVIIAGLPIEDMRSANIVLLYTIGEKVKI
jgi:pyruvate kinase